MGECFFDCIGKLFLNELEEIFRKGVHKSYVRKEENVNFIKGKILHKEQITNYIRCKPKQMCRYEDLTFDNIENRIVLRSLSLLVSLVKENKAVKNDLLYYLNMLKEEVSLVNVEPEACKKIKFNKLNIRYKEIISLSYVILRRYFIRSTGEGSARGFNFIVDMNKLYEDFLTAMIKDVVSERMKKYAVVGQANIRSLERNGGILTKPDILIRSRADKETAVIIDAKYKKSPTNDDFYQVVAYSLAIPNAKKCALIYPSFEKNSSAHYCIDRDLMDPKDERSINLSVYYVDVEDNKNRKFETYVEGMKYQVRGILEELVR
jgi:5-methylcytosine-specific restriction enzyme subunit McrC